MLNLHCNNNDKKKLNNKKIKKKLKEVMIRTQDIWIMEAKEIIRLN